MNYDTIKYMKNIKIYSTPTCVYCVKAKEFFKKNNLAFTEINVAEDDAAFQEMYLKSGQMGVPVIAVDDEFIPGFNPNRLKQLLGIS